MSSVSQEKQHIDRVHFIGIGGSGMSGIALEAHHLKMTVTGSDLKETRYTKALKRAGIEVSIGHDVKNLSGQDIDVVVVSTAVPENNPELKAAREAGLEIWQRARMLAYLSLGYTTLAVAGTHGKTTTSSMLASALDVLEADPTFLIGGVVNGYDSNARHGHGKYMVVEADESDGSFVWLDPHLAVITNIEVDHIDHYPNMEAILESFKCFLDKVEPSGALIVWAQAKELIELAKKRDLKVICYGMDEDVDLRVVPCGIDSFKLCFADGEVQTLRLGAVCGQHNMLNSAAVMAVLDFLGFDRTKAAAAISSFRGVRRRFDRIGHAFGVEVVDDYAHHPTEIASTLKAAAELGYSNIHVIFQPHRYSRTEALINDFAAAFVDAGSVSLMDIYSAGEAPIPGVNSQTLAKLIAEHDAQNAEAVAVVDGRKPIGEPAVEAPASSEPTKIFYVAHRSDVAAHMASIAKPGDLIITMGAGDVTLLAPLILEELAILENLDAN